MNIIYDRNTLKRRIDSIKRRGKQIDADIHVCAVSALAHAQEHGDVSLCTRLANAMPKSGRRKALIHWFSTFGPVQYHEKKLAFGMLKGQSLAKHNGFDIEGAEGMPFWELTPEKNPKPTTFEGILAYVEKKVQKMQEEGRKLPDAWEERLAKTVREATLEA